MLTKLIDDRWKPLYDKRDHYTPLPEVYPKACGFRDINKEPKDHTYEAYYRERKEEWKRQKEFDEGMKRKRRDERWGWQN